MDELLKQTEIMRDSIAEYMRITLDDLNSQQAIDNSNMPNLRDLSACTKALKHIEELDALIHFICSGDKSII